jgi:hypothetical protein
MPRKLESVFITMLQKSMSGMKIEHLKLNIRQHTSKQFIPRRCHPNITKLPLSFEAFSENPVSKNAHNVIITLWLYAFQSGDRHFEFA